MKKCLVFFLFLLSWTTWAATPAPAEKVFKPQVKVLDPNTLLMEWDIRNGAYLYRDRIHFRVLDEKRAQLGAITFPEGDTKEDAILGRYTVYRHHVAIPVHLLAFESGDILLDVQYQGCTDAGFCYPPCNVIVHTQVGKDRGISGATLGRPTTKPLAKALMPSPTDSITQLFTNHSIAFLLMSFFGLGLLLAFTPCVLPMVPVLSGIIVGHESTLTTAKAFFVSLTYVLSMALTYALAGVLVATAGSNLQIILQEPWVIAVFALVFVLLALSMFGYYDLKLPVSWQAAVAKISHRQKSGAYLGAAIMGALSTLILSPCVTAPLVGALAYIADSGDPVLGGLALFAMGLGMGAPLLAVGTAAGHLLPKVGMWMNIVKDFFGWLLLATAIYLLDRILPGQVTLLLTAALFIITSAYLWKGSVFARGCSLLSLIYGGVLLIGAGLGNTNPFQPLENVLSTQQRNRTEDHLSSIVVTTVAELKQELNRARQLQKPVFLDYYADWCVSCKITEKSTFRTTEFQSAVAQFVVIKADITQNNAESNNMRAAFQVVAPPTYIFIDNQGIEIPGTRLVGEAHLSDFLSRMDKAH